MQVVALYMQQTFYLKREYDNEDQALQYSRIDIVRTLQKFTLQRLSSLPEYMTWPVSSANDTVLTSD